MYNVYLNKRAPELNPNEVDVNVQVQAEWKVMNYFAKEKYRELAKNDKIRFSNQEKELKIKGYYTLEDGSSSLDAKNSSLFYRANRGSKKNSTNVR